MKLYELQLSTHSYWFKVDERIATEHIQSRIQSAINTYLRTDKGQTFIQKQKAFTWADVFEVPNAIYTQYGIEFLERPVEIASEIVDEKTKVII